MVVDVVCLFVCLLPRMGRMRGIYMMLKRGKEVDLRSSGAAPPLLCLSVTFV